MRWSPRFEDRAEGFDASFADITDNIALIAVQGPNALEILQQTEGFEVDDAALEALKYYACMDATYQDVPVLVGRTGYTGEDGFELFVDVAVAEDLWHALMAAGAPHGLVPAGSRAGTPSASRRGWRCTATSSASTPTRCRRASAGSSP